MPQNNLPSLWVNGSSGRMGQELQALLRADANAEFRWLGGTSHHAGWPEFASLRGGIELVLDFSLPAGNRQLLQELQKNSGSIKALLIGTTGLDHDVLQAWQSLAKERGIAVLLAPNTSLGISLALKAALTVLAPCLGNNFDIEIGETHHRDKKDAPSGTALYLADQLKAKMPGAALQVNRQGARKKNEIGIYAARGGGVGGEHEIRFLGDEEELCISHRVFSRSVFARGALLLAGWALRQKAGFYTLSEVEF